MPNVDLDIRGKREVSAHGQFAGAIPRQRPIQLLGPAVGIPDHGVDQSLAVRVGNPHQHHVRFCCQISVMIWLSLLPTLLPSIRGKFKFEAHHPER